MSQLRADLRDNTERIKTLVACHFPLLGEGISKILEDDGNIDVVSGGL
jgi:hypothetical protein